MELLQYIIFFTILGSIISLIGGVLLLFRQKIALKISHLLSSFAAGALLGTAFFDLLPEAIEETEHTKFRLESVFLWVLIGILFFFLIERFLHWYHHHQLEVEEDNKRPIVPLIIIGDSVHNLIDGVAIAFAFLVNVPTGIITALAVGAHEIPQEIGDFGVLLKQGMRRTKILLVNFVSALAALVGAILAFYIGERIEGLTVIFLSITAGFFIYIALSDLVPEIHHENRKGFALIETLLLILGIITMYFVVNLLHSLNLPH